MKKTLFIALVAALMGLSSCTATRHRSTVGTGVYQGERIDARFQGSDGITRRVYRVGAVFYTEAERAIVTVGNQTYDLKQYPTASGYGYRNEQVDLRGKGTEATLDFTDPILRDLTMNQVDR